MSRKSKKNQIQKNEKNKSKAITKKSNKKKVAEKKVNQKKTIEKKISKKKTVVKSKQPPPAKQLSCVGSSFIKLCLTNYLFQTFPNYREGKLTDMVVVELPKLQNHLQTYSNGRGRYCTNAFIGNFLYLNGAKLTAMFLTNFISIENEEKDMCSLALPLILPPSMQLIYNEKQFQKLEEYIGYNFLNQFYLLQAFTCGCHELAKINGSYQRLEFLGDSILEYLISRYLYNHASNFTNRYFSRLRLRFTKNETFALLTAKHGFQSYILHGAKIDAQKVYADIFESLAAAIFLDSGMNLDVVWNIFYKLMKECVIFNELDSKNASI